jgi:hypothetical protein
MEIKQSQREGDTLCYVDLLSIVTCLVLQHDSLNLPRNYIFFFTFFSLIWGRVRLSPLNTKATTGLLYQPRMMDGGECGAIGDMRIIRRNRSTRRKPVASATLYATNLIWPDLGSKLGLLRWKPTTNRLSYGTAGVLRYF